MWVSESGAKVGAEQIVADVTEKAIAQSPDAVLVVVSNPLDAMCHVAKNVSGFPRERVLGMAGIAPDDPGLAAIQSFPSSETPPAVTRQCTWG